MAQGGAIAYWDVYRAGSQTFAERLTMRSTPEPQVGEVAPLRLSPPVWRVVGWEAAGQEGATPVYKVWAKRTSI